MRGALWLVDFFRKLCRKRGVAESFLAWPQSIVRSLHAILLLYVAGGIPLSFIVGVASGLDDGTSADSIGRLAFVSLCLLLAVMLRRMVRPSGAVIGDLLRSNPNSMMYRLRWLWYPLAVGSPLCLAVLALMGYQYTAQQLMIRLQLTLVLSIVLVISYTMLMQWMLAAKRSLAMKQARARRAAALAAAQRETDDDGSVEQSDSGSRIASGGPVTAESADAAIGARHGLHRFSHDRLGNLGAGSAGVAGVQQDRSRDGCGGKTSTCQSECRMVQPSRCTDAM